MYGVNYWHDPPVCSERDCSMRFLLHFFYQTVPPGPISDVLGPFNFLTNFHRFIGLLKRFPGVWDTGETIRIYEVEKD